MENTYWLGPKRASFKLAQQAGSAEARLIHYDLAGRYGLKALSAEDPASDLAAAPPAIYAVDANAAAKDASDA